MMKQIIKVSVILPEEVTKYDLINIINTAFSECKLSYLTHADRVDINKCGLDLVRSDDIVVEFKTDKDEIQLI